MTPGHFSFRFVICASAAREMPEIAEQVAVPAVTFDPETTTERRRRLKQRLPTAGISLPYATRISQLMPLPARYGREGRPDLPCRRRGSVMSKTIEIPTFWLPRG